MKPGRVRFSEIVHVPVFSPGRPPGPLQRLVIRRVERATAAYFFSRIDGVNVTPISSPSGEINRLTLCPHGSFLFFTSI